MSQPIFFLGSDLGVLETLRRKREKKGADALWVYLVGRVESGRIKNGGRMEKLEDRKDFIFSPFCLVGSGKVKGWKKLV